MLPKEIQERMRLYEGMKNALDNSFIINQRTQEKELATNAIPALSTIAAADYYEPQLEAKDKEIAAKDEKIRLLEEQHERDIKVSQSKDFKIAELQAEIEKLKGLLLTQVENAAVIEAIQWTISPDKIKEFVKERKEAYCKEKGIE